MNKYCTITYFSMFLFITSIISCNFQYNENSVKVPKNGNLSSISIAKKSLQFIKEQSKDSLIGLFSERFAVIISKNPKRLFWLMKEGNKVFSEYVFPEDSFVTKSQSVNFSFTGKKITEIFSFPFRNKIHNDSLKYFHITVIDKEIQKILIRDYPPGMRIIEPKHKEPHLEKLNMKSENIKWFRIWYDDGSKIQKEYGYATGYYAVTGDRETVKEIGLNNEFQDIFNLINTAKFDSLDYKYLDEDRIGKPEWIYLRFRFDNVEYKKFGEFEISYFIDEEAGKKEILSDYIIIKHSKKTRYLLLKSENKLLVEKLIELAHHNFGEYYGQ